MWRPAVICVCALVLSLPAQQPKPNNNAAELDRIEDIIHQLTEMKTKMAAMETQIDTLLRALSEQKGALQQKPQVYNALAHVESVEADAATPKTRCAAITASGKRCTRPAKPGSRYCAQHEVAHTK